MLLLFVLVVFLFSFVLAAASVLVGSHFLERNQPAVEGTLLSGVVFGEGPAILKDTQVSSITIWGNLLNHFDFAEKTRSLLAEAGMSWTVGRLTSLMLLMGAFTLAILTGLSWPFLLAFVLSCGAAAAPYFYVLRKRSQRFDEFKRQFPDALDFLSRSLRAGHPLPVSLELLALEESAPLSTEMRKTAEERRLGMQLDQALDNLGKRVPLINVRVFIAAVKLSSRTGGKLSEVLDGLAETMREADSVEGEVKALAAHGKITGAVLTALPLFIAVIMSVVNPGYLNILLENPVARILVVCCLLGLVAAHFVIRKIVDIKV